MQRATLLLLVPDFSSWPGKCRSMRLWAFVWRKTVFTVLGRWATRQFVAGWWPKGKRRSKRVFTVLRAGELAGIPLFAEGKGDYVRWLANTTKFA